MQKQQNLQTERNDQETEAENDQMQPPEPRAVSLRLLAEPRLYRCLSLLNLLRPVVLRVLGNHGEGGRLG